MAQERFWKVMFIGGSSCGGDGVCLGPVPSDPDTASDFAYTVGLATRGLPELHLTARPTHGDDPGADWALSAADCTVLLNGVARRLVAGALQPGDRWREDFDGGLVHAELEVGGPVDPRSVKAYGAGPGAVVLPLRWSLHRPPQRANGPLDPAAEAQLRVELSRTTARLDPAAVARLPPRWRPARVASFDHRQPFGPLEPLVVATAAAIATADEADLCRLAENALALARAGHGGTGAMMMATELRTAGRTAAGHRLAAVAPQVARLAAGRAHRPSRRWRVVTETLLGRWSGTERKDAERGLREIFEATVGLTLELQVVADVASDGTRRAAGGCWAWVAPSVAPSPLWWASREVLLRVRNLVGPLDHDGLVRLGEAHEMAECTCVAEGQPGPGGCYRLECVRLRAAAMTAPVGMPRPESWLLGTPAGAALLELTAGDSTSSSGDAALVMRALAAITTAVASAAEGMQVESEAVVAAHAALLPGLAHEVRRRAAA